MSARSRLAHVARGAAIGVAEAVPGVSGGTIALITGVYERLIASAGSMVNGVRAAAADVPRRRGWARAGGHLREVHWSLILPLLVGMVPGLLLAARLLEPILERHPEEVRGLFFGLVLAAISVPVLMIQRPWRTREVAAAVVAAVAAFVLTGLPVLQLPASPALIILGAALAVCALVLPGVSGSFLLLTLGLYEPTIAALNDRDLGYLAIFAFGMVVGLSLFVKLLQWLLEHRRRMTLAVLTGVIAGSLRALWPWQTEDRGMLAPGDNVALVALLCVAGVAVVTGAMLLERGGRRRGEVTGVVSTGAHVEARGGSGPSGVPAAGAGDDVDDRAVDSTDRADRQE